MSIQIKNFNLKDLEKAKKFTDQWIGENYYALDVRKNVLDILSKEHSSVNAVLGDCEKKLKFEDKFFDRVIALNSGKIVLDKKTQDLLPNEVDSVYFTNA